MIQREQPIDIIPPEMIAFIAYNIGVYESVITITVMTELQH
jgi:translation initiation factor 2B subunit (eIF-2B alpha/beta/delta family)